MRRVSQQYTIPNTKMKTLSTNATVIDRAGYIQSQFVQVCDFGDTISIGSTEHCKNDLTISCDKIESIHGWTVLL